MDAFAEKPYKIVPKSQDEAFVVVPRFVPFNVGWLHEQNDAWNVFVVNKYVDWITELPDDIRDRVGIEQQYEEAQVHDDTVEFSSEDERDQAWDDLGGRDGGLYRRKGDTEIKIKNGKEFEIIAELIEQGNLPFTPQPVADEDLRDDRSGIQLRPYQERAWEKFRETGMVGIYWCPGAGKTFISLYIGDRINGKKLVVVPSRTLKEQWEDAIHGRKEKYPGAVDPGEWEIQTYQYLTHRNNLEDYQNDAVTLTIFDECHRLPANTFSKLATIDTTYRMGLSASPYREDGRTDYIFALTGYPIGLKWQELIELGAVQEPDVTVYLYSTQHRKRKDVANIVAERAGKILIFCDAIQKGKRLSQELDVPFVHGDTSDRMETFRENRVVIGSRVADEGVSLDELDTVVEYDFHGGSRRQEAQRVGRVMHSDGKGEHIVMMTDEEYEKHGQRLYSLEEQGFNIRFERRR
ncbi:DEAD/DEAH box helicase family protein [Haloterrigena sp. SYSU A558-1]|uniref:DNA 3'-5' helicase n=1 Tax=Haloterrigena gelatinilytica TaxID=2741724 RepID=A0ABX2LGD0_9EURY|nr:DEAD/DEAH box helicase family protein [Haloterrigena gelatinilytica]NUC74756.1 DEAD/DEAH box helicase family protein [Haloterrigena gelatinilytica]